jgi:hypothetical protein
MAISLSSESRKKDPGYFSLDWHCFQGGDQEITSIWNHSDEREDTALCHRNFSRIGRLGVFTAIPVKRMISPLVQMLVKSHRTEITNIVTNK